MTVGYVSLYRKEGPVIRSWAGPFPMYFLYTAEAFEVSLITWLVSDPINQFDWMLDGTEQYIVDRQEPRV